MSTPYGSDAGHLVLQGGVTDLYVLRVFLGPDGRGGNPLGVVFDGPAVPRDTRQGVAAELGFSETVFVDDAGRGTVEIYTPAAELGFAGHPLVGTSWLLRRRGAAPEALRPPAGEVPTWADGDATTWIRGRAEWAPPMTITRYGSPAEVDALDGPPEQVGFLYAWAWRDEGAGLVRSRMFAPDLGIVEDEATGAAAVRLTHRLARPLDITQGVGSRIVTRPGPGGTVDVGGQVMLDEIRPL